VGACEQLLYHDSCRGPDVVDRVKHPDVGGVLWRGSRLHEGRGPVAARDRLASHQVEEGARGYIAGVGVCAAGRDVEPAASPAELSFGSEGIEGDAVAAPDLGDGSQLAVQGHHPGVCPGLTWSAVLDEAVEYVAVGRGRSSQAAATRA